MRKITWLSSFLLLTGTVWAQPAVNLTLFADGFTKPLELTHCGDARNFVVQQNGYIYILDQQGVRLPTPFLNIDPRVNSGGNEQGLLGLAFHPDYKNNGYFYVNYTNSTGSTIVSRFSVSAADSNLADASSELILLNISQPYSNHNGGHIAFGDDGYLYVGMGDGGSGGDPGNRAQNRTNLLGKMLRIDVDATDMGNYGIPQSNPFAHPNFTPVTEPEIWAIGMRNPWRFSFDRIYGDMWIGDVGQDSWEEIDFESNADPGGRNYGWRCYEGNANFNTSGCGPASNYTAPVYVFANSGSQGCSVSGGYIYRGGKYANLYGYYLFTDYCVGMMRSLHRDASGTLVYQNLGSFSNFEYVGFGEDVYGELYIMAHSSGEIYRIGDNSSCNPVAQIIAQDDTVAICAYQQAVLSAVSNPGMSYQWFLNGAAMAGETSPDLLPTVAGWYQIQATDTANASCTALSDSVYVRIGLTPGVSFTGLSTNICSNTGDTDTLSGLPAGGTFSGLGITNNVFDPAGLLNGNYQVTYTYSDSIGCVNSITQTVAVSTCVSADPARPVTGFRVFPNPAHDRLQADFTLGSTTPVRFSICNLLGQEIWSQEAGILAGTQRVYLNLPETTPGLYLIRIQAGTQQETRKIVLN